MYSGTTLTPMSGRVLGAHQKIDRLARRSLSKLGGIKDFPDAKLILHFEGVNGPDAIKRKSPARDEPWHYYTPFDSTDHGLVDLLGAHYDWLVDALKRKDEVRAAFEAAWLAHTIVDGLTPAHHYPYEQKLTELRGGKGIETRNNLREKIIMPGATKREKVSNNWKMWGVKGLLMSHFAFEIGVSFMLVPISEKRVALRKEDLEELREYGVLELFRQKAREIASLNIYERYQQYGWTPVLARTVRSKLIPVIVHTVALAWYAAALDAGVAEPQEVGA
jgi:hypothetical protein